MKNVAEIKSRTVFIFAWLSIAVISTGIAFVFIIGFKALFKM